MKFIGIAFMALGLVYSIQPAGAQALPGWRISEICARDSAEGQCRLYEAVAHQRVAASWDLLPREWRQSCLNSIRAPLEPSWRILSDCMDSKIRLSIMQRKTKEEAVELQKLEALEARRKAEAEVAARKAAAEAEAKRKAEVTACQDKLREIASKDGITFKTNGTEIDKRVLATLDELVQTAKSCANVVITVEGHTDSTGSEEANKRVSQRRAQAVVDYFIGAGLDANYVKAVGYGNTRPIATNDTARGRAQNRRIQFTVR